MLRIVHTVPQQNLLLDLLLTNCTKTAAQLAPQKIGTQEIQESIEL